MNAPPVESSLSLVDFLALIRDRCDAFPEKPAGEVLRELLECVRPDLADAIKHLSRHWDAPEDAPAGYFPEGVPFKVEGKWCFPVVSPDMDARLTGCSLQQAYMLGFDDASDSVELTRRAAAHRLVNEITVHLEARFDLDFGDIDDIDDGAEIKAAWVALALKHMGGDS